MDRWLIRIMGGLMVALLFALLMLVATLLSGCGASLGDESNSPCREATQRGVSVGNGCSEAGALNG